MALDIALVGVGRWGRNVLRDLVDLGCRVTAVARGAGTAERARALGAHAIVGSLDELPDVAGAVVVTPTATHAEVVESLLDRDVPVFVEKPLAPDADTARRLAALGEGRLFVMDKWRYHPGVEELGR